MPTPNATQSEASGTVGTDESFDATLQKAKSQLTAEYADDESGEPGDHDEEGVYERGFEDEEGFDQDDDAVGDDEGETEEDEESEEAKEEEKLSKGQKRRERERRKIEARVREEVTQEHAKQAEEQRNQYAALQSEMSELQMTQTKAQTTVETAAAIVAIYEARLAELGQLDALADKIEIAKRDHLLRLNERTTEQGQNAQKMRIEQAQNQRQRAAQDLAAELKGMAAAAEIDSRRFLSEIRIRAEDAQAEGKTVDVKKLAREALKDMTKRRRKRRSADSENFTPLQGKGGSRRSGTGSKPPDVDSSDFGQWATSALIADAEALKRQG